jgi:type VI secretion system Hcp family effector
MRTPLEAMTQRATKHLSSLAVLGAVAGLLIGLAAPAAVAAPSTTIALKLVQGGDATLQGDSTIVGHVNEIIVVSFHFSDHLSTLGGGVCDDLVFTKNIDRASPRLLLHSFVGNQFQAATFYFLDTSTRTPDLLFTVALAGATIDAYTVSAEGGPARTTQAPTEQVSLKFNQISFTDQGSGVTTGWDCVRSQAF